MKRSTSKGETADVVKAVLIRTLNAFLASSSFVSCSRFSLRYSSAVARSPTEVQLEHQERADRPLA